MTHKVEADQLELLRSRVRYHDDIWFGYENQVMDSSTRGELQFLLVGTARTHKTPPNCMPDTSMGTGWKWRLIGSVNLRTGAVTPMEKDEAPL